MPFLGSRFVFTPLLAAIGAILLFIASAAGLAVEPRALAVAPDLSHVSPRFPTLRPMTDLAHDPTISADADLNISVAVNLLFIASAAGPAIGSRVSVAIPNLSRALSYLTDLNPTTDFDSESLATAGDYANIGVAPIADANISSSPPTECASQSSALPSLVRSSSRLAMPSPTTDFHPGSHVRADASAGAGFIVASADAFLTSSADHEPRATSLHPAVAHLANDFESSIALNPCISQPLRQRRQRLACHCFHRHSRRRHQWLYSRLRSYQQHRGARLLLSPLYLYHNLPYASLHRRRRRCCQRPLRDRCP